MLRSAKAGGARTMRMGFCATKRVAGGVRLASGALDRWLNAGTTGRAGKWR